MTTIYSQIAPFYHEMFPVAPALIELLKTELCERARVLDIGCGNGHITASIARSGFTVLGTDLDSTMIQHARQRWPETDFMVLDTTELHSLAGGWDCICCLGNMISYLLPDQKHRLVTDVWQTLKPGGLWLTQFVNWDAILKTTQYSFPVKELPAEGVVFKRLYHHISPDSVIFHTELVTDTMTLQEDHTLYPVTVSEFQRIHLENGFERVGHWHDFTRKNYNPATLTGNVFLWRKTE